MLIPSVRVMLSANVSGDANARHHIRTEHATDLRLRSEATAAHAGAVWLRHFNASLLLSPAAPGAFAPSMRHLHRAKRCRRLVRRVTPMNRGSVVSRRARPLVIFGNPPIFKHHPDKISKSRQRAQHEGAKRQSSNPLPQGHRKQTHRFNRRPDAFRYIPARHPVDPGNMPSVPSSRTQKAHSACCPRVAAKCRHGSRAVISPLSRPIPHPPPRIKPRPSVL